ncbi:L,D-transpeptidase family protein [Spirosoma panaciterrae]|uniref:L,D-transpeptidase family protein n=1 Tax=Spirosoma panaciterrae TaxID=496058 RepID=UPI0003793FA1|nr:L,D-transpeptidase family protein [Spirosoma panaciterrae]
MDKQKKIIIGAAVGAGLIILFFVGRWWSHRKADREQAARVEQKRIQDEKTVKQAALSLHQLCLYADSIGIDTSRYGTPKKLDKAEIDANLTQVLLEARYGKKPSQLAFNGLKEAVDSSWAKKTEAIQVGSVKASLLAFEPYAKLVGHYNRLRKRVKGNPAASDSLRLIRQTLNFYRYVNRFNPDQFVVVNIPAGELNVFDRSGKRLLPMQVITGKPDRRTPCMTTYIQNIIAYPYWNVPQNIALEEIVPHVKRDVAYLYNQNFQVLDERNREVDPEEVDWDGITETNFPYRIRQASGCENSLGLLKFDLANPLAIYLHDTNSRDLFKLTSDRWRSHGCVRVQKPVELANLVLGEQTFDNEFMNKCLIDQKPRVLKIPKPFPVFITYNIADVDATGKLRFYKDIYGWAK